MRTNEIIFESKEKHKHKAKKEPKIKPPVDDEDDIAADADLDKTPHIMMQLRKALDVNGNYPVEFKDGGKSKIPMGKIMAFVKKYIVAKPMEKERLQNIAANSLSDFMSVVAAKDEPKPLPKIKGDRYMSGFAGDYDEK